MEDIAPMIQFLEIRNIMECEEWCSPTALSAPFERRQGRVLRVRVSTPVLPGVPAPGVRSRNRVCHVDACRHVATVRTRKRRQQGPRVHGRLP